MSATTPTELLDIGRELGLDLVQLEELMGVPLGEAIRDGRFPSPDDAYRDLQLLLLLRERRRTEAAKPPREKPAPFAVGAGVDGAIDGSSDTTASGGARDREEREIEAAAFGLLPHAKTCRTRHLQCQCTDERRAASTPIARPARSMHYRRLARPKGSPLPAAPWWLRSGGCSRHDVWEWLSTKWQSPDIVEAAVVRALRRSIYDDNGNLDRPKYAKLFGAIALAFTLWHLTRVTLRRGSWAGVVIGMPRGELARMLPVAGRSSITKIPGNVAPGTITRYLRQLRKVLGREGVGLLEWHQPSPDAVVRYGLPRSKVVIDGEDCVEGFNLYTFRGAEFVKKNTPSPPAPPHAQPVDLRSGHFKPTQIQRVSAHGAGKAGTSGGSRDGPAAEAGLTPASAAPSAPRSARRGEAQGG